MNTDWMIDWPAWLRITALLAIAITTLSTLTGFVCNHRYSQMDRYDYRKRNQKRVRRLFSVMITVPYLLLGMCFGARAEGLICAACLVAAAISLILFLMVTTPRDY